MPVGLEGATMALDFTRGQEILQGGSKSGEYQGSQSAVWLLSVRLFLGKRS